jgi:hypothetical protein
MIQLLTSPQVLAAPAQSHRFMVELASIATELTADGIPVPVATVVLDVLVAEPSLGAITKFLSSKGLLEGFQVMKHWVPQDGCDCF